MRRLAIPVAIVCLSIGEPAPAFAQSATTGAIAGAVKDTSGAVLPGVTVEAASPALIEKVRTVVTDEHGEYKVVDLRPGQYTVRFTLSGFTGVTREGLELNTGVTLPVSAELPVGNVSETITVTGASPVVDVQNVQSQNVLTREVLDTLPSGKSIPAYAALTLGAVSPGQDVGGNKGEQLIGITIHGSRAGDGRLLMDGMNYGQAAGGRFMMMNQISVQEVTVATGGSGAEAETGGAILNAVPREGGNRFKGLFAGSGTGPAFQGSNLSDELQARGLASGQEIKRIWDFGGGLGGPLKRDRLWFYTGHRWWGSQEYAPGNYFNATQNTLFYTPDLNRQAYTDTYNEAHDVRVTWQASLKHKFAFTHMFQDNCLCFARVDISNQSPEAANNNHYYPENLAQIVWDFPATNAFLIQAGATYAQNGRIQERSPGVSVSDIPVTELSTGYSYNARPGLDVISYGNAPAPQANGRFIGSYVTGSHALKVGFVWQWNHGTDDAQLSDPPINYAFRKATPDSLPVPVSITQFASPHHAEFYTRAYGLFAQDQWTVRHLTLNLGLRFDYQRGSIPAQTRPGGVFTPPIPIAEQNNILNWKDVNLRLGSAYDLFGTGKTAIKWSLGRYVLQDYGATLGAVHPAASVVTSATRNWNDYLYPVGDPRRGDYVPQCDLTNPALNDECGPLSANGFGTTRVTTTYSPEVLHGWQVRPFNWQTSVGLQHELRPGMGMSVTYFRTAYGNFRATDNVLVTPSDYGSYCLTAPVDQRVAALNGGQACGFYDLNPNKFGQTQNVVTPASTFGDQVEIYNGVDMAVNTRFGRGGMLNGGASISRTSTDNCFVVDSPQQLKDCHVAAPWSAGTQVKLSAAYPLPWDFQASATFQNLPGIPINTSYVAGNAEISPTLGRNLGSCGAAAVCTTSVTVGNAFYAPSSVFEDRLTQVDFRVTKIVRSGPVNVKVMFDIYNMLNANTVLTEVTTYSPTNTYLRPTSILAPRLFKFGVDVSF